MTDETPLALIARVRRAPYIGRADAVRLCDLLEQHELAALRVNPPAADRNVTPVQPPDDGTGTDAVQRRNVTCPVCEAHRKANAARVRKHRQRLPEPAA
jgi:hypothetical protein